jgi:nucleotide-binding universal stress UspA family protein
MIPVSQMICATDFSDPSYEGLRAAVELAQKFQAKLTLVHVVTPLPAVPVTHGFAVSGIEIQQYMEQMNKAADEELGRLAARYSSPGFDIAQAILSGEPAHEIAAYAAANRVDMIVLSTHGLSGWKRLITGSVAERVVRLAECAVLTVHRKNDDDESQSSGQEQEARNKKVKAPGAAAIGSA